MKNITQKPIGMQQQNQKPVGTQNKTFVEFPRQTQRPVGMQQQQEQYDFANLSSPLSGTELIDDNLEPWRDALHTTHSGTSRPSYVQAGMLWLNTTTNPWVLNLYDGAGDIPLGTFNTSTDQFTPSNSGDMTLAGVQAVTGLKTFNKDKIAMKGTSTGVTVISTANTSATDYTFTLPAATDTAVGKATTDTLTSKTMSGSSNTFSNIALASLANQTGDSIVAEVTGSSAAPTAVTIAANKFPARASTGHLAAKDITDFALTLLDDANASDMRTTLGIAGTGGFTLGTPVTTTSGTTVDFTGIPSTVNQITVSLGGVSTSGTSIPLLQLGNSGGIVNSGYLGRGGYSTAGTNSTAGLAISDNHNGTDTVYGTFTITRITSNTWNIMWCGTQVGQNKVTGGGAMVSLGAALDRVRLTTVNGTDTFDAGTVNICYL